MQDRQDAKDRQGLEEPAGEALFCPSISLTLAYLASWPSPFSTGGRPDCTPHPAVPASVVVVIVVVIVIVIVIVVVIMVMITVVVVIVVVPGLDVDCALTRDAPGPEGDHQNGQAERDDRGVEGLGHGPASAIDVPDDLVWPRWASAGLPASIATERR
jgi:hypothetical protein